MPRGDVGGELGAVLVGAGAGKSSFGIVLRADALMVSGLRRDGAGMTSMGSPGWGLLDQLDASITQ
jgi:hypothetical protein